MEDRLTLESSRASWMNNHSHPFCLNMIHLAGFDAHACLQPSVDENWPTSLISKNALEHPLVKVHYSRFWNKKVEPWMGNLP
ncbi:hypothetical protein Ahy_A08g037567 isoform E [Arachis hypogaea]|uniref:Uncharacterized protein n=1 Tax=Arachis hypogaea TaxID=3818 RepID=A0A445BR64_ARAHY|nr:hypothetical protein Ahy_A08g037567 isoform E [Arachis hypogaea]